MGGSVGLPTRAEVEAFIAEYDGQGAPLAPEALMQSRLDLE